MKLTVAISHVADGTMAMYQDLTNKQAVLQNRSTFLQSQNIDPQKTTRVKIVYKGQDYCRYHEVGLDQAGAGMSDSKVITADGLVTRQAGQALFLPLADCVGMVIFDPIKCLLMLSHIGRHSLEQNGGYKSVKFLVDGYNSDPSELLIWLTPAPGQASYPLFAFNNRSFKDVVFEQLKSAGIIEANITDNPTDTTTDRSYYSHSEYLKGNRSVDGRYAVVALITT